tara:strand:+ start:10301 stop:10438 length:138 start_codon:yes stop_codon:yes gene_type:complete
MEPVLAMAALAALATEQVKLSPQIAHRRICEMKEARNFRQRPGEN